MQNYQRKSYVTQLHKVYNEFQQATVQYMTDRNAVNLTEAGLRSEDAVKNFIKTYFKIVQDCGEDQDPCFALTNEYKKISGVTIAQWYPKRHYLLASGASIGTFYRASQYSASILEVWVDTNGAKGPNIVGRDFFVMYMYNGGELDEYDTTDSSVSGDETEILSTIPMSTDQREKRFQNYCLSNSGVNYHGCFGKILNENWEMTY